MGYYTNFTFTTPLTEDQLNKLSSISGYTHECDGDLFKAKWYEYKEHMIELSRIYPNKLFQIDGDGEDDGDIWRHYFKNGKSLLQKPKIVFEEFKESELK